MNINRIISDVINEFVVSNNPSDYAGNNLAPGKEDNDPMYDVSNMFPDMYTDNAYKYYSGYGLDDAAVINQIKYVHNKPNRLIKIYRAVPNIDDAESFKINNGDWVTTSKLYAKQHGESNLYNNYKILTKTVKVSQLYTDGNSIFEWGYVD